MTDIKCTDLSLGYDNNIIIEHLSFSVERGDYLCIVGENGSGKSTLIKGILGLITPFSGRIDFGDATNPKIGYLPQQSEAQKDFPASVREVVLSGCRPSYFHLFYGRKEKKVAYANMKRLGIEGLASKSFSSLSGGQKQRTFLARALCSDADIILLDEPSTGLDPIASASMYEILAELNKKDNISVIMVSHDISSVLQYATHILHIGDSSVFFGTKHDYLKSPEGASLLTKGGTSYD